jgi:nitrate/nitrite-specific signal transduction histidine kinase
MIGGTVISIFEDTYVKTLTDNAILQENAYNVQSLMNQYKFKTNSITGDDFKQIESMLEKYDYQLYVSDGRKKMYSNLKHNQLETAEIINSEISYSDKSVLYVWEDKTIIARKITASSTNYNLIVIHSADIDGIYKLNMGTFELPIISFLIVGIGSILIILLISRFFTQRLVNQIMFPIQKLMDGAGRIKHGNLDEPIIYEGEDEFEMVCKSFNQMQESF